MKRSFPAGFALVLALVTTAPWLEAQQSPPAAPPPQASMPTFTAQVEEVLVDTVVADKKGGAIADLEADDFVITEDGTRQTITKFERVDLTEAPQISKETPTMPAVSSNQDRAERLGRTFVLLFDDINLSPQMAYRAKGAVTEFLRSGVRDGDRVMLVSSSGSAWWTAKMPWGRDEMVEILKRLDGRYVPDSGQDRVSEYEALRIHVYRDPQVSERVRRRFEQFGVAMRSGQDQSQQNDMSTYDDPLVSSRAQEVYYQAQSRIRLTLDTIKRLSEGLAASRGRKSIVLISQGFIYDTSMGQFRDVIQSARRANAAIYFLDTRGLEGMPSYLTAEFGSLIDSRDIGAAFTENIDLAEGSESLAADSGGFTVKNNNDLTKGIQRIADESRTYYMLGYQSTNSTRDGKFRKIQVKLAEASARKGLVVRARKGYYALVDEEKAKDDKDKDEKEQKDPAFQTAVDSPFDIPAIPIRMSAYVFDETTIGKLSTLVTAEVDVRGFAFTKKDERWYDTLELFLVTVHRESGEFLRVDQAIDMKLSQGTKDRISLTWYPIIREFELKPGAYQAKIVIRDRNSGLIGSATHEFIVKDPIEFRTCTPVVSDTLEPKKDPKDPPRPAIVAHREFDSGSSVYMLLDVYAAEKDAKAMPQVSMGYEVRRVADGALWTSVEPSLIRPTSLGKVNRLVGFKLEDAPPGEYVIVIDVTDEVSSRKIQMREPFTVKAAPAKPAS